MTTPNYLRRENAARHVRETWGLPCSPKWLAKLAVVGGGPLFRKAAGFRVFTSPLTTTSGQRGRIGAPRHSTSVAA